MKQFILSALTLLLSAPLYAVTTYVPTVVVVEQKLPAIFECIGFVKSRAGAISFSLIPEDLAHIQQDIESGYLHLPDSGKLTVEILMDNGEILRSSIHTLEKEESVCYLDAKHLMSPGQCVLVSLIGIYYPKVIAIPDTALKQESTGLHVFVVNSDNQFIEKPVELGYWHAGSWTIRSGINNGERIVSSDVQKVQGGFFLKEDP